MSRRANRRVMWFFLALALLTVLALVVGSLVAGRSQDWPFVALISVGALGLVVTTTAAMVLVIRRRGEKAVSPLWGADRDTRRRVAQAIKGQGDVTGRDRDLAIAEATRIRRLGPLLQVALSGFAGLELVAAALQFAGGHRIWQACFSALGFLVFAANAAHQRIFYHRAGAFLERCGER